MNYKTAKDLLDGKGKKRNPRNRIKIANNTWLERNECFRNHLTPTYGYRLHDCYQSKSAWYPDNAIGLRFHETYVAVLTPRYTELFTGGWNTKTTSERINMGLPDYCRVAARGSSGWGVFLRVDGKQCYCVTESENDWYRPGMVKSFKLDESTGDNHEVWIPCHNCHGAMIYSSSDWSSGGHTFYDGMRISADGKKIMREQPHRPTADLSRRYKVLTESGGW